MKNRINVEDILDNSPDIIFTIDTDGKILYANPSFYAQLGYSKDEVIGKSIKEFIVDKKIYKECMLSVKATGVCLNQDTFFKRKDGSILHVIKNVRAITKNGKPEYIIVNARDITIVDELNSLLEEAKDKLERQNKHLEKLVKERTKDLNLRNVLLEKIKDSLPEGLIFLSSDGQHIIINKQAEKLLNKKKVSSLRSLLLLIRKKLKNRSIPVFIQEVKSIINNNCEGSFEVELKNGKFLRFVIKIVKSGEHVYGYLVLIHDITVNKKIEKELKDKLYKDQLTGLPNRTKLIEDIEQSKNITLAILNIDDFKEINDFYGHDIGDLVLKDLARLIKKWCSNYGLKVYRLSGDEFGILANRYYPKHEFVNFIQKLISSIEKRKIVINDYEIHINLTAGIAEDKDNILSKADMALKLAKEKKKPFLIFEPDNELLKRYKENIIIVKKLRYAFEHGGFVIHYQPILSNKTGKIEEYECLVRLIDENGNIVPPLKFLDVAKKTKMYSKITRIVINQAFEKFKNKKYRFAINLSVSDILDYQTVNFIIDRLKQFNGRNRVVFEILESEGIENFEEVSKFIKEIKSLGAKVAIDDFGSGYSNFEFLLKLEVDYLKIDASIIKNIHSDIYSHIIAETIVSFCKKLGIKTIAEYVCSEEVFEHVKSLDIDYSQGFFIGKPEPLLKNERSKEVIKN